MSRWDEYGDSADKINLNSFGVAWVKARSFRRHLVDSGWMTPNTYDCCFSVPTTGPAVYLFLLHGMCEEDGFPDFDRAFVAYVGMSKRLMNRWAGHPILREIEEPGRYIQKWFRPTPASDLRSEERLLIQSFNPPWNIQGRKRGVAI